MQSLPRGRLTGLYDPHDGLAEPADTDPLEEGGRRLARLHDQGSFSRDEERERRELRLEVEGGVPRLNLGPVALLDRGSVGDGYPVLRVLEFKEGALVRDNEV